MDSLWKDLGDIPRFAPLQASADTDVLIVGGGMAGLLCARMLKAAGVDCMLVEAKRICSGTTGNTTAKITLQHGLIYSKLIKDLGQERAALYLQAQRQACKEYARLCRDMDCDYEVKDSYVYSLYDPVRVEQEVHALNLLGEAACFCEKTQLPFSVAGAVQVSKQAQFHPLKFAYTIAKELPVYENTKVLELMPYKALTDRGEIRWKKLIIATHFPILNKHGAYFLKLYQHRSYVLALEGAGDVQGMYVDEDKKGLSFRNCGDLLLLGGGSHRTGKRGGNWKELESVARKYYPEAKWVSRWATQDCMSLDGSAYIGQYSRSTQDVYVATGFHKWGMTSSMVAARLLTDLILEKDNAYREVFCPQRSMLHPQLAVNTAESLLGLLTPTAPRCPHMGCALKYNPQEHSWDCPCHGSRFTQQGQLLDNPATDDKK
ncbi:MAG: FAD-dependent oxidoreductase [Oscillospiraceae bacterium]|nr:FAD-dependent oxidoreductase [Oscillospiraceae bacterium]